MLLPCHTNRVTVGRVFEEHRCQLLVFRCTINVISACSLFVVSSVFGTSMSRTSEKQQFIRRMHSYMGERIVSRLFQTVVEDDNSVEDIKDAAFASMICVAKSIRYLFCADIYRKTPYDRFVEDMVGHVDDDDDDDEEEELEQELISREASLLPWLKNEEFLQKCGLSYSSYKQILSEIKDHDVFKKLEGTRGRPQTPVANQLMMFLKYVGMEGMELLGLINETHLELGKVLRMFSVVVSQRPSCHCVVFTTLGLMQKRDASLLSWQK